MSNFAVELIALSKQFNIDFAVNNLELSLTQGEILALVGPSGCGKTTTLRLIAGFERPESGEIFLEGNLVGSRKTHMPTEARGVGMVFQDYALFPHLSVFDNIAFGLNGKPKNEINNDVNSMLSLVNLQDTAERYPHELSGGQRQRVGIARTIAMEPKLVVCDESVSALDISVLAQVL
ncbi:MAG: ABC transporter ATP-binding protein, partial [Chloroflexota bacterium]